MYEWKVYSLFENSTLFLSLTFVFISDIWRAKGKKLATGSTLLRLQLLAVTLETECGVLYKIISFTFCVVHLMA